METIDWIILLGTLSFIVIFGIWKNNSHKYIQEYLKGGNKARWWTVGLSVMATQASAITFLSTPGQAYHDGMGFVQFYFGLPFAMLIICLFFIPVYHNIASTACIDENIMRKTTLFLWLSDSPLLSK